MKQKLLLTLVALLVVAALPAAALGTFTDDDGNFHEPNIEAIAAAGITTGCGAGLFCPNRSVTRAEMAAFLIRALNEEPSAFEGLFPDVPAGRWYTGFVERLAQLEITTGYPDGTFHPEGSVTRAEMAAFVVRAIGQSSSLPPYQATFADVPNGQWFTPWVERMSQLGITQGCSATRYCPSADVTRAEMATFLTRAFDLTPITPVPEPPPPGAGNCDPSYPDVCIPPPPPILTCSDITPRGFEVVGDDPHNFDSDGNGLGCEI